MIPQVVQTPTAVATPTATGVPTVTATPTVGGQVCTADCSGDNVVAVNELVTCVGIVLGNTGPDACPACDGNGDGSVNIADLIGGVGNLLTGCA